MEIVCDVPSFSAHFESISDSATIDTSARKTPIPQHTDPGKCGIEGESSVILLALVHLHEGEVKMNTICYVPPGK